MKAFGIAVFVGVVAAGVGAWRVHNYYEARSWHIEVKERAPVYEDDAYPYASQSPRNRIVGYLEPGEAADVSSINYGKDYVYWKVRLKSGERGYLFSPDVEIRREG